MAPIAPQHEAIRTPRLLLRPLRLEDADALFEVRASPGAMDFIPRSPDKSPATVRSWLTKRISDPNSYMFAIELLPSSTSTTTTTSSSSSSPRLIGSLGAPRVPEIGFMLHHAVRGRGLAAEALAAFLPVYWEHVTGRYDFCVAYTDARNAASRKLLEGRGFRCLGVERSGHGDGPDGGERETAHYWLWREGAGGEGDEWVVSRKVHENSVREFKEDREGMEREEEAEGES
ncbi:acyl-CoA N-acyltransferase [Saccharata proteae CBS 121410]|uniref:Acyl-CoA N-acyltransferase n=1 Tax=Saccharata proteae CBS 121410 TaxID=1314787 RepID=A0A6A5YCK4_9PEZI|nr:acyl-CoA N-acyltransferase [Saccharata proteae CBS 121410]